MFFLFYFHFFSIHLFGNIEYYNNKKKYEKISFRRKKQKSLYNEGKNDLKFFKKKIPKKTDTDSIIQIAKNYIYTPYKYGGNSKKGIDCSAFIKKIFSFYKILLPRVSYHQAKKGFFVPPKKIEKGDLLFFSTEMSKKKINHVGMVVHVENHNSIFFIHASTSNGVIISQLYQKYWKNRFITARRILYSSSE
ncbi:C40 family peptidase [Blattabacterium cuenoti]|uniref:C40 family peptidase n=1 Tax=Blattabacterium cuenoti TaxID=1653831 RepID=UPI001EEAF038|nr:C40 family peptidase [Blattabacterium cuenoti]